ncbi:MAG TPA: enoyl-CoA hydratase/isomerase family protein [Desulfuromonadales bacterium]|nr:enoyl-CoA hydratase/isomerase family protein [Desulfuromonadales bacterium]
MPFKKLRIETARRVGYILLDAGSRFNKLSITTIRELKRAFAYVEADENVGAVVLSGYPGESFAVGADIGQMVNFSSSEALAFAELGQSLFAQMEACPKPVIGALNGIAMGGGCDLAMACDIRFASDSLQIAHPGAKLGIITGFCGTKKLPGIVGKNFAREIFMTCDAYGAADALRMGLVDQVCGSAEFWDATVACAERIAAHPEQALSASKLLLNSSTEMPLLAGCLLEQQTSAITNCLRAEQRALRRCSARLH